MEPYSALVILVCGDAKLGKNPIPKSLRNGKKTIVTNTVLGCEQVILISLK